MRTLTLEEMLLVGGGKSGKGKGKGGKKDGSCKGKGGKKDGSGKGKGKGMKGKGGGCDPAGGPLG